MKRSYFVAAAIALAAAGWIGSGLVLEPAETTAQGPTGVVLSEKEKALPRVRVRTMTARETLTDLVVNGQTQAVRSAEMKAETSGRVEEIVPRKGAVVEAGDLLVRLSMRDRAQRLEKAEALVEQRQIEYNAATQLARKDFTSRTRLAEARARLEAARADLAEIREDIANTEIRAPFDGVFNDHAMEVGEYVAPGMPVATVIDLDPMTVVAEVSEREVGSVSVGTPADIRLVDGRTFAGTVTWVSETANPATRTYPLEVEVPNPERAIPEGMTAEVRVPLESTVAHLVSPSVLTLNDAGVVGVKLVNAEHLVEFHAVRVVGDGPDGVWLAGLPDQVQLITVGQEYVKDGQKVEPVPADADRGVPPGPQAPDADQGNGRPAVVEGPEPAAKAVGGLIGTPAKAAEAEAGDSSLSQVNAR